MRKKTGHDAIHYMYMVAVSMVGLTVLSFVGLRSAVVLAEPLVVSGASPQTASATATVQVTAACSMTANVVAHSATIANGIYYDGEGHNGIGLTTLKTTCNDASGYAIYAVGYTGEVIGGTNSTKLVGVKNSGNTIDTGVNESGANSSWAMRIGTSGSSYVATVVSPYDDFAAVPSSYTKVAYYNSSTDIGEGATGSSVTATYAAYISGTQAADTYNGKVRYTMVHPADEEPAQPRTCAQNKICYYANTNTAIGSMGQQTASASTETVLLASNFSREGYGFAGWSDAYDYETNPNANLYGPQEAITTPSDMSAGLSLYAIWIKSEGMLQDSSKVATLCGSGERSLTQSGPSVTKTLNSVSALTDQRDGQTYAIAKLADGNCWMIENLRLEAENSYDSSLAQGYSTSATYGNFSGLATSESANFSTSTAANSLYYSWVQEGTASIDIGTTNYPAYRMPRYNNLNTPDSASDRPQNPTSNSFFNNNTTVGMYSYGNYYTWAAAIADTTYYGASNQSVTNTSLCPSGWRLPKGGNKTRITSDNDNEFWNLTVTGLNNETFPANYDSETYPYYSGTAEAGLVANALRSYPNNFFYSGYFNGSSAYDRGSNGYYWSSTANSNSGSYILSLVGNSEVGPGTVSYIKYGGYSIRCLVAGS